MKKEIKTVVTHDGRFHADDLFAYCILEGALGDFDFQRTRDKNVVGGADLVFDVSGIYDPDKLRYDHHMRDGAPYRDDGVSRYSSAGLIWRDFGKDYLHSFYGEETTEKEINFIFKRMDQTLILGIDLVDNGQKTPEFTDIACVLDAFNETDYFLNVAQKVVSPILTSHVLKFSKEYENNILFEKTFEQSKDKRIIILDKDIDFSFEVSKKKYKDVCYVIAPKENSFMITAVPPELGSFNQKVPFPEEWAGLRDHELSDVSGIENAIFCHHSRFCAATVFLEDAIDMAEKSLEINFENGLDHNNWMKR